MLLGALGLPVYALDCATVTSGGQGERLSRYQVKHIRYNEVQGHIFLMAREDHPVAELEYSVTSDDLTLEVISHSVDPNHFDPTLETELFDVLTKLKPHVLAVASWRG